MIYLEELATKLDRARRAAAFANDPSLKENAIEAWRRFKTTLREATDEEQAKARAFYTGLVLRRRGLRLQRGRLKNGT